MEIIYAASYDPDKKGIYKIALENEEMSILSIRPTKDIPSYLIRHGSYIFACFKNTNKCGKRGGIGIFDEDLRPITNLEVQGKSYTHLAVEGDFIAAADYYSGTVDLFSWNPEEIGLLDIIFHEGSGPDPQRQAQPHLHWVGFFPGEELLLAADLGTDRIRKYRYRSGELLEQEPVRLPPGSGPRHLVVHQGDTYLANELKPAVTQYAGLPEEANALTTLPTSIFPALAGAIRISPTGRSLFVSNRIADTVAYFALENGIPAFITEIPCGKNPRDLYPVTDSLLLVGAQDESLIQLFRYDEQSKTIQDTGHTLSMPNPVCFIT